MSIKIVEGLEPWEVMKRASEGEPVAYKSNKSRFVRASVNVAKDGVPDLLIEDMDEWKEIITMSTWNWNSFTYAIIDTTAPTIEWNQFNFDFFNQYGGLPFCKFNEPPTPPTLLRLHIFETGPRPDFSKMTLMESPFYYWSFGECPVPGNVEVEVMSAFPRKATTHEAGDLDWDEGDIIAFRLTGNVL